MKSQNNSKVIKRPKKITSHKRQYLAARVKMAAAGDVTLTPTLSRQKKLNSSNRKQPSAPTYSSSTKTNKSSKKNSAVKEVKEKKNKKVQRKRKESGPKAIVKEVNVSKRQKWIALNKKQTEFLSNALNTAVGFAVSQINIDSVEKFETQNYFINATKSILMQRVNKVKVPPTKQSLAKTMSKAMFTEVSKDLDTRISSLTEAIDKEKKLLQEKEKLFNK